MVPPGLTGTGACVLRCRPQEDTSQAGVIDTHAAISAALSAALSAPQQAAAASIPMSGSQGASLQQQISAAVMRAGSAGGQQQHGALDAQLGASPPQQQRQSSAPSPLQADRWGPLLPIPTPHRAHCRLPTRILSEDML